MPGRHHIPKKITAMLVYGRPPLVFAGMLCAIAVMWTQNPVLYTMGVVLLFVSMTFDLVDGWFAARFHPHPNLAQLADRIMDKVVYSIIFPLVAVGVMWRLHFISSDPKKTELLHAILVLLLAVTVLVRDNFAHFMRGFALRKDQEPELTEFTRLRTIVAAPVSALLYAYAFYVPEGPPSQIYRWISWLGNLPLHGLFFIEIIFLIINFGSIAGYCHKYGTLCLDELCLGNDGLRRRILAFFPNALTVMNAMMGLLAVFFAYQGRIREGYLFLIGAALFDKLDGAVARKLGLTEALPEEERSPTISLGGLLDDISDAVSFCIAPAWIFYITLAGVADPGLQRLPLGWVAGLYALLGIGRLIYFTLDKNPIPGFFKGMPTPAAALLTVAPLIICAQAANEGSDWVRFWGIFSFGLMIGTAGLMNLYPIRYLHLGRFMSRHPWFARMTLVVMGSVFTPYFGEVSLIYMALYSLSPLVTWRIDPKVAARETKTNPAGRTSTAS
ncbi:MAG: CDP-alcohol phosphatidyltransferase family protein [Desulfobacterales bacterium]|nr:MAG: CDP-alcohol phosphatidyltransferase family protein [Desulfobacterales bacterium]